MLSRSVSHAVHLLWKFDYESRDIETSQKCIPILHPSIKSKNNFLVLWMSFIIVDEGRSKQWSSLKAKQLFYKGDMSSPPEDYLMKRLSVFIHTDSCWSGTACPSDLICVTARDAEAFWSSRKVASVCLLRLSCFQICSVHISSAVLQNFKGD